MLVNPLVPRSVSKKSVSSIAPAIATTTVKDVLKKLQSLATDPKRVSDFFSAILKERTLQAGVTYLQKVSRPGLKKVLSTTSSPPPSNSTSLTAVSSTTPRVPASQGVQKENQPPNLPQGTHWQQQAYMPTFHTSTASGYAHVPVAPLKPVVPKQPEPVVEMLCQELATQPDVYSDIWKALLAYDQPTFVQQKDLFKSLQVCLINSTHREAVDLLQGVVALAVKSLDEKALAQFLEIPSKGVSLEKRLSTDLSLVRQLLLISSLGEGCKTQVQKIFDRYSSSEKATLNTSFDAYIDSLFGKSSPEAIALTELWTGIAAVSKSAPSLGPAAHSYTPAYKKKPSEMFSLSLSSSLSGTPVSSTYSSPVPWKSGNHAFPNLFSAPTLDDQVGPCDSKSSSPLDIQFGRMGMILPSTTDSAEHGSLPLSTGLNCVFSAPFRSLVSLSPNEFKPEDSVSRQSRPASQSKASPRTVPLEVVSLLASSTPSSLETKGSAFSSLASPRRFSSLLTPTVTASNEASPLPESRSVHTESSDVSVESKGPDSSSAPLQSQSDTVFRSLVFDSCEGSSLLGMPLSGAGSPVEIAAKPTSIAGPLYPQVPKRASSAQDLRGLIASEFSLPYMPEVTFDVEAPRPKPAKPSLSGQSSPPNTSNSENSSPGVSSSVEKSRSGINSPIVRGSDELGSPNFNMPVSVEPLSVRNPPSIDPLAVLPALEMQSFLGMPISFEDLSSQSKLEEQLYDRLLKGQRFEESHVAALYHAYAVLLSQAAEFNNHGVITSFHTMEELLAVRSSEDNKDYRDRAKNAFIILKQAFPKYDFSLWLSLLQKNDIQAGTLDKLVTIACKQSQETGASQSQPGALLADVNEWMEFDWLSLPDLSKTAPIPLVIHSQKSGGSSKSFYTATTEINTFLERLERFSSCSDSGAIKELCTEIELEKLGSNKGKERSTLLNRIAAKNDEQLRADTHAYLKSSLMKIMIDELKRPPYFDDAVRKQLLAAVETQAKAFLKLSQYTDIYMRDFEQVLIVYSLCWESQNSQNKEAIHTPIYKKFVSGANTETHSDSGSTASRTFSEPEKVYRGLVETRLLPEFRSDFSLDSKVQLSKKTYPGGLSFDALNILSEASITRQLVRLKDWFLGQEYFKKACLTDLNIESLIDHAIDPQTRHSVLDRFDDGGLVFVSRFVYPYQVLSACLHKMQAGKPLDYFKSPAQAEDLMALSHRFASGKEAIEDLKCTILLNALQVMQKTGNPFAKSQIENILKPFAEAVLGNKQTKVTVQAGGGKTFVSKQAEKILDFKQKGVEVIFHIAPFESKNEEGDWVRLNQWNPVVSPDADIPHVWATVQEFSEFLVSNSPQPFMRKALYVIDEWDICGDLPKRLRELGCLRQVHLSATQNTLALGNRIDRKKHKFLPLEESTASPTPSKSASSKLAPSTPKPGGKPPRPSKSSSKSVSSELTPPRSVGKAVVTDESSLKSEEKYQQKQAWIQAQTVELSQIEKKQKIHLDRESDLQVMPASANTASAQLQHLMAGDLQQPGGYLIAMPGSTLSERSGSRSLTEANLREALLSVSQNSTDRVSMVYRDLEGDLKGITCSNNCITPISFTDLQALYKETPHKVICLYTKDCQGGDFYEFSRENVQGQAIVCPDLRQMGTNFFYQMLARFRCIGDVGTEAYDTARQKAKTIRPAVYLSQEDYDITEGKNATFRTILNRNQEQLDRAVEIERIAGKITANEKEIWSKKIRDEAFASVADSQYGFSRIEKSVLQNFMTQTIQNLLLEPSITNGTELLKALNRDLAEELKRMYPPSIPTRLEPHDPYRAIHQARKRAQDAEGIKVAKGSRLNPAQQESVAKLLVDKTVEYVRTQVHSDAVLSSILATESYKNFILRAIGVHFAGKQSATQTQMAAHFQTLVDQMPLGTLKANAAQEFINFSQDSKKFPAFINRTQVRMKTTPKQEGQFRISEESLPSKRGFQIEPKGRKDSVSTEARDAVAWYTDLQSKLHAEDTY